MSGKVIHLENLSGLNQKEVSELQQRFGKNIFSLEKTGNVAHILWDIFREPMFILLIVACTLYFILGKTNEGWMMTVAILFVSAVSFYQEVKSTKALAALKELTEPKIVVIRDGMHVTISSAELVPGDIILLEEGNKIPADGKVMEGNDLTVNESVITGESVPAEKNDRDGHNILYQGSIINSGKCYATVTAIGNNTELGKLGKSVSGYSNTKTLLQIQIGKFVKNFALFGISAFFIIWIVNYFKTGDIILSLLFGLTLAMASIPEEIPVAFSSFMALGAFHMSRMGIISRQPQTIENLGAVSVICLDKTGTLTENKMEVKFIYDYASDKLFDLNVGAGVTNKNVLKYGVLASEINPFDAMEKAIINAYDEIVGDKAYERFKLIYEYSLEGQPPMMSHVYEIDNTKIIAAKGAAERIIKICKLDDPISKKVNIHIRNLASKGYRVIGVASAIHTDGELPLAQDEFEWKFEGLLFLYDPPKKNIAAVFKKFYDAKIKIKLITGDFHETAINIAEQVGIPGALKFLTGEDVRQMGDKELQEAIKNVSVFARMFPEAKLKVIEALKANGEIVAMTGDGVNDAPALKSAHIGIAMGMRGTEMARQSADLILTDDNLDKVVEAVRQGRTIYSNFKKAVRYIISIHIPIIFTAALPLLFGWKYPNIFTPIHIIFFEIIMGPTCSIFYEREPVEKNIMQLKPRSRTVGLFTISELIISVIQGMVIATGVLMLYYLFMKNGHSLEEIRTIVFTTLILSNIFLTFVNRSFTENFLKTFLYKNTLVLPVLALSILFLGIIHFVLPVRNIFGMTSITTTDFLLCIGVAALTVMWFEVYKTILKKIHS